MFLVAISLGFFGSLHCIGMCGPLALMACKDEQQQSSTKRNISYQLGRISCYGLLGIVFGMLGQVLVLSSFQKLTAILAGLFLVGSFIFSKNVDTIIQRLPVIKSVNRVVHAWMKAYIGGKLPKSAFLLGVLNGLLPCGLVYLALAGAVISSSILSAVFFMLCFGLGTVPAMAGLVTGFDLLPTSWKRNFNRFLPYVSLCFGLFLIYRGVMIAVPAELNFFEALKHPILCH